MTRKWAIYEGDDKLYVAKATAEELTLKRSKSHLWRKDFRGETCVVLHDDGNSVAVHIEAICKESFTLDYSQAAELYYALACYMLTQPDTGLRIKAK